MYVTFWLVCLLYSMFDHLIITPQKGSLAVYIFILYLTSTTVFYTHYLYFLSYMRFEYTTDRIWFTFVWLVSCHYFIISDHVSTCFLYMSRYIFICISYLYDCICICLWYMTMHFTSLYTHTCILLYTHIHIVILLHLIIFIHV